MLRVRVSKVTSEYLKNEGVVAGKWYDFISPDGKFGNARVDDTGMEIIVGMICPHLHDNEQTEWEVSDVD